MNEKDFEISRRKALAGLGVVGVASAGAGLGTTAYFSDEESFENNTITAGDFALTVDPYDYRVLQDNQSQHFDWEDEYGGEDDPGAFVGGEIGIDDAKPGDEFKFCWKVTISDNPGYALVRADNVDDLDGSQNPDPDVDVNVTDLHDTDTLATLGETASATVRVYPPGGPDEGSLSVVDYNPLNELLDSLKEGVVIGDDEDPLSIGPDPASYPYVVVCVYISLGKGAASVGNEIQGASLSADLEFYAEQARHNDNFPSESSGSQ